MKTLNFARFCGIAAVITLAASVSVLAGADTPALGVTKAIKGKPLLELPAVAARLVAQAKAAERLELALASVRVIVGRHPALAPALVAAIAAAAPEVAVATAVAAAELRPEQAAPIARAAALAAPNRARELVSSLSQAVPAAAVNVAAAVPAAAVRRVELSSAAKPASTVPGGEGDTAPNLALKDFAINAASTPFPLRGRPNVIVQPPKAADPTGPTVRLDDEPINPASTPFGARSQPASVSGLATYGADYARP
ncbi:MAG: hypothetical protein FJ387_07520 [Verrucomicrobia bacterium]|nr:hypothetical protein [Verrucomicrobiota bacterium]